MTPRPPKPRGRGRPKENQVRLCCWVQPATLGTIDSRLDKGVRARSSRGKVIDDLLERFYNAVMADGTLAAPEAQNALHGRRKGKRKASGV